MAEPIIAHTDALDTELLTFRLPTHLADMILLNPEAAIKALEEFAKPSTRRTMLQEADATINGPRQNDYGDTLTNFSQISMIWQGLFAHKLLPDSRITPEDVAIAMIAVKMARLMKSPDHYDSVLDIAGYAGCYDHIQKDRAARRKLKGALHDARASE